MDRQKYIDDYGFAIDPLFDLVDVMERCADQDKQRIADLENIKIAAIYFYEMWCDGSVDDEAEAAEKLAALLPGEE